MTKLTTIAATIALSAGALIAAPTSAQAIVPTSGISATLNNAGDAVLLKCLAGAFTGATTATLNAYYVTVSGSGNISATKSLAGDTITLGLMPNSYFPSDTLEVEVRDQNIYCDGNDFAWGAAYVVAMTKTVSYDANLGVGTEVADSGAGAIVVSSGSHLSRSGYTLASWNTAADGSGTTLALTSTFTPAQSQTLYAQWIAVPVAATYNGPIFNPVENRKVNALIGGKILLSGRNLSAVTKVSVAGKSCETDFDSLGRLEVLIPAGMPGEGALEINFGASKMAWANAFTYFDPTKVRPAFVAPKAVKPKRKK